jgi:hypothetical protein
MSDVRSKPRLFRLHVSMPPSYRLQVNDVAISAERHGFAMLST